MQTKEVSSEKQLITFDIPLNETGSAGLGISVKGKTSTSDGVTTDLGIFIKAVIHGGAASKVSLTPHTIFLLLSQCVIRDTSYNYTYDCS